MLRCHYQDAPCPLAAQGDTSCEGAHCEARYHDECVRDLHREFDAAISSDVHADARRLSRGRRALYGGA